MSKKILVVDDEPDIIAMLDLRLSKNGYDVISAVNAEECLKKAEEDYPDLILLDILLPGMSGFEVAKKLKANKATKDIPIIMVTALIGKDAAAKGLNQGAEYFISKPFDPESLLTKIKDALANKNGRF